jgi:hypothetical protein
MSPLPAVAWAALTGCAAIAPFATGAPAGPAEIQLILEAALPVQGADAQNLIVDVDRGPDSDGRVWGTALSYSNAVHPGVLESAEIDSDRMRFHVNLSIEGDQWRRENHRGEYRVALERRSDGWKGTFEGTFAGSPVRGNASAQVQPARPAPPAGFDPVRAGERPRVLFRASEIPALRERLATPFGLAYAAKVTGSKADIIGLGILHRLTGDRSHADRAREIITGWKGDIHANGFGSGGFGHRFVETALAYDLCADAWPEEFRADLETRLLTFIEFELKFLNLEHANTHPCSNYFGPGHGAPAIASLVFAGDPGPGLAPPVDPVTGAETCVPPEGYTAAEGVPVADLTLPFTPLQWLVAGPLPARAGFDLLGAVGGYAGARPKPGTEASYTALEEGKLRFKKAAFAPLDAAMLGESGVSLDALQPGGGPATVLLYSAVRVASEQAVRIDTGHPDTRVFVSGREVRGEKWLRLMPGLHPFLVVHATGTAGGEIAPRIEHIGTGGEAVALHALRTKLWERGEDIRKRLGGADSAKTAWVDLGRQRMVRHYRYGVGDGGFQAETGSYADIASWYPLVYAGCHRRVFGRDVSPRPDITHLVPRRLMQLVFPETGKPLYQRINSKAGLSPEWCAAAFPIVPTANREPLLWAWNRIAGATSPEQAPELLESDNLKLALAFLNHPLEFGARPPAASGMPLAWQAPTFGFECFRSGWAGADDFVAQVFLKASPVKGWNHPNAGTWRLLGLGKIWAQGSEDRVGFREQEPVVQLPGTPINEGACASLAHRRVAADGSAVLTVDYTDVYGSTRPKPGGGNAPLYDSNLLRIDGNFAESGVTGFRALFFDYSNASGAPCLMAMADRIAGGGPRLWQWTLPPGLEKSVRIEKNRFLLTQGDATLCVTFIEPRDPVIEAGADSVGLGRIGDGHRSFVGTIPRVKAWGTGDFLVVATISRGAPPEVRIDGTGLGARVSVGQQRLRLQGNTFVPERFGAKDSVTTRGRAEMPE